MREPSRVYVPRTRGCARFLKLSHTRWLRGVEWNVVQLTYEGSQWDLWDVAG